MAQVRTYDPKSIIITIGSHTVTSYGEDTFVAIEPQGDGTAVVVGADGEVGRSMSNNPMHQVTITVQQTSPTNDYLSDLLARDKASGGGGVVPLEIADLRGNTMFGSSQAWVRQYPTQEFGNAIGTREWIIDAIENDIHVGGSQGL